MSYPCWRRFMWWCYSRWNFQTSCWRKQVWLCQILGIGVKVPRSTSKKCTLEEQQTRIRKVEQQQQESQEKIERLENKHGYVTNRQSAFEAPGIPIWDTLLFCWFLTLLIRKTLLVNRCYNMIREKGMKRMIGWFRLLGILVVICLSVYLITWEVGYERVIVSFGDYFRWS